MTTLLREVFEPIAANIHSITEKIENAYLLLGFVMWRALHDEHFLALGCAAVDSPILRRGATIYDLAKTQTQRMLSDGLTKTVRTANYGPKPDIKPGLLNVAKMVAPYIARTATNNPVFMMGAALGIVLVSYTLSQSGMGHDLQNTAAALYGTAGNQPKPKAP